MLQAQSVRVIGTLAVSLATALAASAPALADGGAPAAAAKPASFDDKGVQDAQETLRLIGEPKTQAEIDTRAAALKYLAAYYAEKFAQLKPAGGSGAQVTATPPAAPPIPMQSVHHGDPRIPVAAKDTPIGAFESVARPQGLPSAMTTRGDVRRDQFADMMMSDSYHAARTMVVSRGMVSVAPPSGLPVIPNPTGSNPFNAGSRSASAAATTSRMSSRATAMGGDAFDFAAPNSMNALANAGVYGGAGEEQPPLEVIPGVFRILNPKGKFSIAGSTANDAQLASLREGRQQAFRRGFGIDAVQLAPEINLGTAAGLARLEYYQDPAGDDQQFMVREGYAQVFTPGPVRPTATLRLGIQDTWAAQYSNNEWSTWYWNERPLVYTRLFDGSQDGLGATLAIANQNNCLPVRLVLGAFNVTGQPSVIGGLEGGFVENSSGNVGGYSLDFHHSTFFDFAYLARLSAAYTPNSDWGFGAYVGAMMGPNGSGKDADTTIYGAGAKVAWLWQYTWGRGGGLTLEGEYLQRQFQAHAQGAAPHETLVDSGYYASLTLDVPECKSLIPGELAFGARYDRLGGGGDSFLGGVQVSRHDDPTRDDQQRFSGLIYWAPNDAIPLLEKFSFFFEYNYDQKNEIHGGKQTVIIGVQVK
jgi:hypothetical protein